MDALLIVLRKAVHSADGVERLAPLSCAFARGVNYHDIFGHSRLTGWPILLLRRTSFRRGLTALRDHQTLPLFSAVADHGPTNVIYHPQKNQIVTHSTIITFLFFLVVGGSRLRRMGCTCRVRSISCVFLLFVDRSNML